MTGRFRINRHDVAVEGGLRERRGMGRHEGAVPRGRGQGWLRRPPPRLDRPSTGSRHDRHRHPNADEFLIVLSGSGMIYTDDEDQPAGEGDVLFTRRGLWHGFDNTGDEEVTLVWGWSGAGSLDAAGYELPR